MRYRLRHDADDRPPRDPDRDRDRRVLGHARSVSRQTRTVSRDPGDPTGRRRARHGCRTRERRPGPVHDGLALVRRSPGSDHRDGEDLAARRRPRVTRPWAWARRRIRGALARQHATDSARARRLDRQQRDLPRGDAGLSGGCRPRGDRPLGRSARAATPGGPVPGPHARGRFASVGPSNPGGSRPAARPGRGSPARPEPRRNLRVYLHQAAGDRAGPGALGPRGPASRRLRAQGGGRRRPGSCARR